ncbi:MAG: hypothetical protein PHU61_03210 [Candidatus Absconditabacteria bacterium]|nr:hypothetical protein [Candidatus Absconditabacteria bacterium]MDD3868210.1 hypothetical protein [Candidatus Absconditabacteria bacterium]MDD4714663.1 hypothetical protein [Candidatus Absconditabacteria bacterium]
MKKLFSLSAMFALALFLTACGTTPVEPEAPVNTGDIAEEFTGAIETPVPEVSTILDGETSYTVETTILPQDSTTSIVIFKDAEEVLNITDEGSFFVSAIVDGYALIDFGTSPELRLIRVYDLRSNGTLVFSSSVYGTDTSLSNGAVQYTIALGDVTGSYIQDIELEPSLCSDYESLITDFGNLYYLQRQTYDIPTQTTANLGDVTCVGAM